MNCKGLKYYYNLQKDCMGKFSYNTHEHVSDQNL